MNSIPTVEDAMAVSKRKRSTVRSYFYKDEEGVLQKLQYCVHVHTCQLVNLPAHITSIPGSRSVRVFIATVTLAGATNRR